MRGDENSPHLVIQTHEGNVHIVPAALIEDWIEGRQKIHPDCDDIVRAILDEWLTHIKEGQNDKPA